MNRQEQIEAKAAFFKIFQAYVQRFGHTFTSLDLEPNMPAFFAAYEQMEQCLEETRSQPVTNESIGRSGEGVID